MEPRISLITLGVADVAAARSFYERLGFRPSSDSNEHVTFMDAGGLVLALFGRAALAIDVGVADKAPGFSGVTLAHNVSTPALVDRVIAEAATAGATIVKPAAATFWGGYAGYIADLDGHLWEIAHNPFWPVDANGRIRLPEPAP